MTHFDFNLNSDEPSLARPTIPGRKSISCSESQLLRIPLSAPIQRRISVRNIQEQAADRPKIEIFIWRMLTSFTL